MGTLPKDDNGALVPLTPSNVQTAAPLVTSSISSSTTRAINVNTRFIRCYATGQDVVIKWGSTAVTTSNFDEICPQSQLIDFVVPIDQTTGVRFTTMRIIQRAATATLVLMER